MIRNTQRVVSLLPSATQWLGFLGYASRLVGISHECDDPPEVVNLPRVTRSRIRTDCDSREIDRQVKQHLESQTPMYDLNVDRLASLQPDVIITQSLCNVCAVSQHDIASVSSKLGCQLLDLRGHTFRQVLEDAAMLVEVLGSSDRSEKALQSLFRRIEAVQARTAGGTGDRPRVTLLEWTDPLFCSGHWTPELISWAGGVDPIGRPGEPSRQISLAELIEADPNVLLVACCGFDLDRTRREWEGAMRATELASLRCVREGNVHLFDGSAYFNRPGPGLVDALERVAETIEACHRDK